MRTSPGIARSLLTCIHVIAAEAIDIAMSRPALLTVPPTVMAVLLLPPQSLRLGASAESSWPYWNAGLLVVLRKMACTATVPRLLVALYLLRPVLQHLVALQHLAACRCWKHGRECRAAADMSKHVHSNKRLLISVK